MIQKLRYAYIALAAALTLHGCYDDKGSYDYKEWTSLVSVGGVEIPGSSWGRVTLLEGDMLEITPEIVYKEGFGEADFTFHWVMGGDTIGSSKDLRWEVVPTASINTLNGEAYFWLAINNTRTGEVWKYYATDTNLDRAYMVKVKISPTAVPYIGAIVYRKADGALEWASIKGTDKSDPAKFAEVYTGMYSRYNPEREPLTGDYAGGVFSSSELHIYTGEAPGYGVMVQTGISATIPFGQHISDIAAKTFMSPPAAPLVRKNYFYSGMQEILLGTELYTSPANSEYPYQLIEPSSSGDRSDVAQITPAAPYTDKGHMAAYRSADGKVHYYTRENSRGFYSLPLTEDSGLPLVADEVAGLFRTPFPKGVENPTLKFFLVARTGADYYMYVYSYDQSAESGGITFLDKKNVTAWAGGTDSGCRWFTTVSQTGWTHAYIAKGRDLWRFSYEALTEPVLIKSFAHDIREIETAGAGDGFYTVIATFDPGSGSSSLHFLNLMSDDADELNTLTGVIPGEVLEYLPYN